MKHLEAGGRALNARSRGVRRFMLCDFNGFGYPRILAIHVAIAYPPYINQSAASATSSSAFSLLIAERSLP